jgi:hypothetical protein
MDKGFGRYHAAVTGPRAVGLRRGRGCSEGPAPRDGQEARRGFALAGVPPPE